MLVLFHGMSVPQPSLSLCAAEACVSGRCSGVGRWMPVPKQVPALPQRNLMYET